MANVITFDNSTIFTGDSSTEHFLIAEMNDKQIGIPVYKFSASTPDLSLFELKKSPFKILEPTFYPSATSYGVGMAIEINSDKFAFPIYKVTENDDNFINLKSVEPTIVSNVGTLSSFAAINIDDEYYGVPLHEFSGAFMGDETLAASAIKVTTALVTNIIQDVSPDSGSTHLNSKIRTYSKMIDRVKRNLGWPSININICDENMVDYIDQSLEYFTKYAGYTEEFLMFTTRLYKKGKGIKMDDLFSMTHELNSTTHYDHEKEGYDYDLGDRRRVIDVHGFEQGEGVGINTLFTLEQAMAQQTYYGYMLGNTGFDLVTWEVLKGWLDTRKKVLAQTPYIRFDDRTQLLKIIPEPHANQHYVGVVACYVERRVKDLIAEPWVIEYTLALTSIALGRIYGKFTNMALPIGGGSINYGDLQQYGLKRKEELEKELYSGLGFADTPPPAFFIG